MKKTVEPGKAFACPNYQFVAGLVKLFAPGPGVLVGAANGNIEIIGKLPRVLRRGLKRAASWCEPLSRRSRKEPCGPIVWRTGWGVESPAFNINNFGALADLLAEVAALKGGSK